MHPKYIVHYRYVQDLIFKGKLAEHAENNTGSVFTPVFKLDNMITGLTLEPGTRSMLLKLDHVHEILCNICSSLSIYHMAMIYVELGDESPEWKAAIDKEMATRESKFKWQHAHCSDSCVKHFTHVAHTINCSPGFFDSQIKCGFTFFDSTFPSFIQHVVPSLQYKKCKFFFDYILDDITFGIKMPFICASMKNIKFCDSKQNEFQNNIYASFFIPPIDNVDVKFSTSPDTLCNLVGPDETVECLLVFTTGNAPHSEVDSILNHLNQTQSTNFPIMGAYKLLNMVRAKTLYGLDLISYVAFTRKRDSKQNFTAASILINGAGNFEERLVQFKNRLTRHKEEFCLNLIYSDALEREDDWAIIIRHFNCPVLQCEANGVFGSVNYFTNHLEDDDAGPTPPKSIRTSHMITHPHYSCALLYVGWGDIKSA